MDDTFSGADFEAASATDSPETAVVETTATAEPTAVAEDVGTPEPAATEPPAPSPQVSEKPKGPIPFEVHSKALENARAKAKDEALGEWRGKYGWLEQTPEPVLQELQTISRLYQTDRPGLIRQLITEALSDAQMGDLTATELGRALSSRRGQKAEDVTEPVPDVRITDEHGNVVGMTYSDKQLAKRDAWREQQWNATLQQKLQPYEQIRQRIETGERERQQEQRIDQMLGEASKWPSFTEHATEIAKALQTAPSLEAAYIQVVVPKLAATTRAQVLADLSAKPSASTVSPSSHTPSVGKPDSEKSWEELFREMVTT